MEKRFWHLLWYCRRYIGVASKISLRGVATPAILGAGILGSTLELQGWTIAFAEGWRGVASAGSIYIIVAWLAVFAFRLLFVAPFHLWDGGHWMGKEFVYDSPPLAYHRKVAPADNEVARQFRFKEAPPYSSLATRSKLPGVMTSLLQW